MEAALPLAGKKVIFCETEALVCMFLEQVFQRLGMIVIGETRSVEEAVALALAERPEVVFLPQKPPDSESLSSLDEIEATRRILAAYPACIILMTSYSDEIIEQKATQAGIRGVLQKPFVLKDLIEVFKKSFASFLPVFQQFSCFAPE